MLQPYFAIYTMYLPGATFGPATLQSPLSGAHRLFRILTLLSSPSPLLLPTLPQTHRNMLPGLEQDPHEGRTSICLLQCCFLESKVRPFMEQTFGKCCRISWCVGRKRGEMGPRSSFTWEDPVCSWAGDDDWARTLWTVTDVMTATQGNYGDRL